MAGRYLTRKKSMTPKTSVKPHGTGCVVTIDVSIGAAKSQIVGVNHWRGTLHVRISAEPRDGAANEELLRFLSEKLGVPRGDIVIMRGEKSSRKVVHLPIPSDRATSALEDK
jgi:uncharacterized protein (TIGR00251 family)